MTWLPIAVVAVWASVLGIHPGLALVFFGVAALVVDARDRRLLDELFGP